MTSPNGLTSLEICAGAGGQALGLEWAGFTHLGALELEPAAYQTLLQNRASWKPEIWDVRRVKGADYRGLDLFAGGVPCPPFSVAGRQLGSEDARDLFPAALEWISESRPKAVMLENVPGLSSARFKDYRELLFGQLRKLGFGFVDGKILHASTFGVSQLRPRFVIVALRSPYSERFTWPSFTARPVTVGVLLRDLMGAGGWGGADSWAERANDIAPTLVGGSRLHGGPDLGPTRSKIAWSNLGVDGNGVADGPPGPDFPQSASPKLTVRMTARLQGFPDDWSFFGRKTAAYRQVGNAFPPPVAKAVGESIRSAILGTRAELLGQDLLFRPEPSEAVA